MVASNPLALVCELTHRCPLHCVYCSNPQELTARTNELSTELWSRVFREASEAGVMQLDLTGGEPLARPDLSTLIQSARASGLYVNLITSGLPLDEKRLDELFAAGLDHFGTASQKSRSTRRNGRHHRKPLRHPHRILTRPILRLGLRQSRATSSHPRTTQAVPGIFQERARPSARQNPRRIRSPRLLRKISQTLHGRLGAQSNPHHAQRRSTSLPRRNRDPRLAFRKCEGKIPGRNLAIKRSIPEISRRRLDAGAVQILRPPHDRLRRLPLSSHVTHRRCSRNRPSLFSLATARQSRFNHRCKDRKSAVPGHASKYCPAAVALSSQSRLSLRALCRSAHPHHHPHRKNQAPG